MTILLLALTVGILLGSGAYLLLRRDPIKLILGLGLISYAINLLIFSTGRLERTQPPIIADPAIVVDNLLEYVDPLPQALILTAIVISFGVTAFTVVLLNRRNSLVRQRNAAGPPDLVNDPFASTVHYLSGLDHDPDDFEWLEYSLAYERQREKQDEPLVDDGQIRQSNERMGDL